MNLLKGGDKKVPKFYFSFHFLIGFIKSIATKQVTIIKITADDKVNIVLGG
jgi:hypothetical protein